MSRSEERKQFSSGAVRSTDADSVRYDLISTVGVRRLAETYAEGAVKYGDNNWQKGMPASECLNHAMRHIELWRAGDASEDHLAHAAWNLFAIMHFEEVLPAMINMAARNTGAQPAITRGKHANEQPNRSRKAAGQSADSSAR